MKKRLIFIFMIAVTLSSCNKTADSDNPEEPTFKNTIKALEYSGEMLSKVSRVFSSLNSANTNDTLQAINRELRQKLFTGYFMKGDNDNSRDNKDIIARIARLRVERSQLLGYDSYADFVLERNMAKTPGRVFEFLGQVWDAALLENRGLK